MATILIVSSDSPVGQSASQHLLAKGYDVVTAASATEGLRALHNLEVDAIVFDTGLGDMSAQDFYVVASSVAGPKCALAVLGVSYSALAPELSPLEDRSRRSG